MGVFARLLRRSKATAETPAAEARTDTTTETETEAAETAEPKNGDGTAEAAEPAAEATESEGVDIPRQQSTDKAADNEAGEGART
ncbi:hypothetical protein QNO09_26705 [Streptomyces sp. 378]|uniref:hypothetical protein n=1 Tax=Streptomyces sp. 378 TaxID=3049412 RepID=UPI0024C3966E|nr:hypothetical protein [Streptomyces sp. 378]MDK1346834.1 hypothetical protein [Streptomyces sp. 378]